MAKRIHIATSMTPEEVQKADELAKGMGISRSELIRALIDNAYDSDKVKDFVARTIQEMKIIRAIEKEGLTKEEAIRIISIKLKKAPTKEVGSKVNQDKDQRFYDDNMSEEEFQKLLEEFEFLPTEEERIAKMRAEWYKED
ncbi:hypothetical protein [Capybara microvirus Cap3_SP_449]|nr:hypothetical protein [Capybara microvirus Cap3_SP_449]